MNYDDSLLRNYEWAVNAKVDYFRDHQEYPQFRKMVTHALEIRCCYGLEAISADVATDLILLRSLEEIRAWLDKKSPLRYTDEERQPWNTGKCVLAAIEKALEARDERN